MAVITSQGEGKAQLSTWKSSYPFEISKLYSTCSYHSFKRIIVKKKKRCFYFCLVCIIYGYVEMCAITLKCKASWRSQGLASNYFGRWSFSLTLENRASSRMAVTESLGRHALQCAIVHVTANNLDRGRYD